MRHRKEHDEKGKNKITLLRLVVLNLTKYNLFISLTIYGTHYITD